MSKSIANQFSDLTTQTCLICLQSSEQLLCPYCIRDLPLFDLKQCDGNLMNLPNIQQCLTRVSFPRLVAPIAYGWPISEILLKLKFSHRLPHAKALADLFCDHVLRTQEQYPDAIIPMPLHPLRYHQRKYNQAIEIGKHISKATGITLDTESCTRIINTPPQTRLDATNRRNNLEGAFFIKELSDYQHIAILDDVVTTGSTVDALFRQLQEANPDMRIDVWAICLSLPSLSDDSCK